MSRVLMRGLEGVIGENVTEVRIRTGEVLRP